MSKQKTGLHKSAYEPIPEGGAYEPYVSASESPAEFTIKSVIPGILFGIAFGAANAYLGLQSGLTISTSIPVAVMTVAAFRAMRRFGVQGSILEANIAQTTGSASSSIASGVIFTLPALFMWGLDPSLLQMTLLAMCGGLLGVLFMIPLRRFLIEREHGQLPYPEGTACAEVLVASEVGGAKAKNVFIGLGLGAIFKSLFTWLKLFPGELTLRLPAIAKAEIGVKMSSALFGVGYILGPKIGSVMVGGGLLSALLIIPAIHYWGVERTLPLFPETELLIKSMSTYQIWTRYVRYIGAGAVATAGIITLIKSIPTMIESFRIGITQLKSRVGASGSGEPRTGKDLSLKVVGIGVLAVAIGMAVIPHIFGQLDSFGIRLTASVCVVVFAFFFVTVSSRIVGLVGVTSNPTSGMTIASLIGTSCVFWLAGWTDQAGMAAALTVGCVVAIAASIAGDTSQDLKTGFLLGATPNKQQISELIGVLTCSTFVCLTIIWLDKAYGFGSKDLAAPQATLMKLVIEGVLQSKLPWALVGIGAGIAIAAEIARIPSLPFAVGVYLPVATMMPVFMGGCLRWIMERGGRTDDEKADRRESGILVGAGLVGGEGLMGVLIAGIVIVQMRSAEPGTPLSLPFAMAKEWTESANAQIGAIVAFGLMIAFFASRCRTRQTP